MTSARVSIVQRDYEQYITRLLTNDSNRPLLLNDDSDLDQPVLSEFDNILLKNFNNALDSDTISIYDLYNERWFNMNL